MPTQLDPALQLELLFRLALAALLGGAVGLERELRGHQAGARTYGLLALGAALFAILSSVGFGGREAGVDPTRIAAQVVTGVGFLCAGAIWREGFTIRGLTTAASLWTTTAIGLAAGAGELVLAAGTTAIVLFSLRPLGALTRLVVERRLRAVVLFVRADDPEAAGAATSLVVRGGIALTGYRLARESGGVLLEARLRVGAEDDLDGLLRRIAKLKGVRSVEIAGSGNG